MVPYLSSESADSNNSKNKETEVTRLSGSWEGGEGVGRKKGGRGNDNLALIKLY